MFKNILLIVFVVVASCKTEQSHKTTNNTSNQKKLKPIAQVEVVKLKGNTYTFGDEIPLKVDLLQDATVNSIKVYSNDKLCFESQQLTDTVFIQPVSATVGRNDVKVELTYNDSLQTMSGAYFYYVSDIIPANLKYKVVNKFPHDAKAYTQGLYYYNGFLYEGTGQAGQSILKKVEIKTGKLLQSTSLDSRFFGEGVTIVDDKIYQLTWHAQTGLIYNLTDLTLERQVHYNFRQGWGLTYDGNNLIMTDGSASLFFLDKEYFTEVRRVEVFDNKGIVDSLNELEYINGLVYANVYGDKFIVAIDPKTGRVMKKLDLQKLFPENVPDNMDHVLNGIAYNPDNGHLFVTGKYWPVLYEIAVLD